MSTRQQTHFRNQLSGPASSKCPICNDELKNSTPGFAPINFSQCGHSCHLCCAAQWLAEYQTCPVCGVVPTGTQQETDSLPARGDRTQSNNRDLAPTPTSGVSSIYGYNSHPATPQTRSTSRSSTVGPYPGYGDLPYIQRTGQHSSNHSSETVTPTNSNTMNTHHYLPPSSSQALQNATSVHANTPIFNRPPEEFHHAITHGTLHQAHHSHLLPSLLPNSTTPHIQVPATPEPLPTMNDALAYVQRVKDQFEDHPHVYRQFLQVLRSFQDGLLDKERVREIVERLFTGVPELRRGFMMFVPAELRE